jgi:hypothetical protein
VFGEAHEPKPTSIEAFKLLEKRIKDEIVASRKSWDLHEPR